MAIALLSRRQQIYTQQDNSRKLQRVYQDRAEFYSQMAGEITARDIAKGNNLIPQAGAPTPSITPWGKSLKFDGSGSHLKSTYGIASLPVFTLIAWVRPAALNTFYTRIIETDYATGWFLGANTASQYCFIVNGAAFEGCIGGQQVVGQRDFIAATFDGTNRLLYINGRLAGSGTATTPSSTTNLNVGRIIGSTIWNGEIDTVGVFRYAFAPSTIFKMYYDPFFLFEQPRKFIPFGVSSGSGVTGSLAYTNKNDTSAASGTTTVTGTLAKTNRNDTAAASGTTTVTGTLAKTNRNDTVAAAGTTTVTGSLAKTNANDSCNAIGSVGSSVSGSLAYTNNNDTAAAAGTTTVVGTLAKTNANDTPTASGTTAIVGSLAKTNANDTCAASGTVTNPSVSGSLAYTNKNDTSAASGTTTIKGSLARTNNNDRLSAFGTVNNGIVFESALIAGDISPPANLIIKKPGIPSGTPDWEKTMFEIMTGRRGNAIPIPVQPALTFSATPTQAECQALFTYVNLVRDAQEKLITRFDS